jgi:hypothetical protein
LKERLQQPLQKQQQMLQPFKQQPLQKQQQMHKRQLWLLQQMQQQR